MQAAHSADVPAISTRNVLRVDLTSRLELVGTSKAEFPTGQAENQPSRINDRANRLQIR